MGRGYNGNEKYVELGPVSIPTGADFVQAKLYKTWHSTGEAEGGDRIWGNVSYILDITYGATAEANIVTGPPL